MSSDCFGASRTGCDPADLFERFEELHVQRIFDNGLVKKILKKCGYEVLGMYDMYTFSRPSLFSDRVNFVARKL